MHEIGEDRTELLYVVLAQLWLRRPAFTDVPFLAMAQSCISNHGLVAVTLFGCH